MLRRFLAPVLSAVLLAGIATPAYAAGYFSDLGRLKRVTAKYHHLAVAESNGYGRFVDVNGTACIDMPGMGAMGVHYVNGELVADGRLFPNRPEAMVYEPDTAGRMRLVAVEYVVLKEAWDAGNRKPPSIYGHRFDYTASPNRYGLPPYYSLHVWVWKKNPAGTFAMWNPRVHYPGAPAGHHHDPHRIV